VHREEPEEFDDILVSPAQEALTDAPNDADIWQYDSEVYARDELYPADVAEVTGPFEIDDYHALLVHVRPCLYNPVAKKLICHHKITVVIDVAQRQDTGDGISPVDRELNREAYGNLMLNPSRSVHARLGLDPHEVTMPFVRRGPEFLIVYASSFKPAATKLAHWKKRRGLDTETVSIERVGASVSKIKSHIRGRRGAPLSRLRYVLLFGDVDMIPAEQIGTGYANNCSDYYYSTQSDPTGSTDLVLPWIAIGRIPVQTADEAMAVADQIIAYERTPPCDPEYYRRMAFGAYFQDPGHDGRADRCYVKTMESIREHMVALGFDIERVYVTDTANAQFYRDGSTVPAEVREAFVSGGTATDMLIGTTSEGQAVIAHRDHGGPEGWVHPSFKNTHLEAISSDYPTTFYSINCQTGRFDQTAPTDCFAEKILKMKGGAPSLVAATRNSGTFRNDSLMKALFDATWGGVLPTFPGSTASYAVRNGRLGDILNYAKSYLPVRHSGDPAGIKDHFEIYHVIGDPTIEFWTDPPVVVNVRARLVGHDLMINLSSCPRGGVLTIWHRGKLLKQIIPSSTRIKISLRDVWPEPVPHFRRLLSVCFAAPGHRFVEVRVRG
jgi:hypothetical protein